MQGLKAQSYTAVVHKGQTVDEVVVQGILQERVYFALPLPGDDLLEWLENVLWGWGMVSLFLLLPWHRGSLENLLCERIAHSLGKVGSHLVKKHFHCKTPTTDLLLFSLSTLTYLVLRPAITTLTRVQVHTNICSRHSLWTSFFNLTEIHQNPNPDRSRHIYY